MKAIWNGKVIAESTDTVEVDGNPYFPAAALRREYFRDSEMHTTCGWKGQASYYHVEVDGEVNENAAWHYPDPLPKARQIAGRVAFWKGVEITE